MSLTSQILQYIISGLTSGSIYAIVGICWSTVFLISGVLNFATGEFVMVGGMLAWFFYEAGFNLFTAALLSILGTTLTAVILERIVIRPVRRAVETTYMMLTIAAASVIKGIILLTCGSEARTIPSFIDLPPIIVHDAAIVPQMIVVFVVLIVITALLVLFFNHTLLGKALRASSINPLGASLFGMETNKFRMMCFALAGTLGAIAGIVIAPISFTGYNIGMMAGLKGLVVGIVGRWTIGGTLAAGLMLGLVETFGAGFISAGWKDAIALFIMIVFLILQTVELPLQRQKVRS